MSETRLLFCVEYVTNVGTQQDLTGAQEQKSARDSRIASVRGSVSYYAAHLFNIAIPFRNSIPID